MAKITATFAERDKERIRRAAKKQGISMDAFVARAALGQAALAEGKVPGPPNPPSPESHRPVG